MTTLPSKPVLLLGGSGVVGSLAARSLRRLQPELPLVIGGRDLAKAQAVAKEIGGASLARIDLARTDLGPPVDVSFRPVAVVVKDDPLKSLKTPKTTNARA